ncbi:hypothetical protein EYF80_022715 [Liparis tanakae]|uniref:Uncharacterized protein n=1 Tax=Liparis tanakae TaxID=230148 RepID=A0A4Z2HMG6_9TELE|nr:hypothetical protein EYF80_022715 [Liparis tanakae]
MSPQGPGLQEHVKEKKGQEIWKSKRGPIITLQHMQSTVQVEASPSRGGGCKLRAAGVLRRASPYSYKGSRSPGFPGTGVSECGRASRRQSRRKPRSHPARSPTETRTETNVGKARSSWIPGRKRNRGSTWPG